MEMLDVAGLSILASIVRVLIALATIYFSLTLLDRYNGFPFTRAQETMNADPRAVAHYRGLRFLAACILAGLIFS